MKNIAIVAILTLYPVIAMSETEHAITIYSSAAPGSISPNAYRPVKGQGINYGSVPGYAMVRQARAVELNAGVDSVQFTDVAALIDPTTVYFESLTDPKNTRVLEQNFQFDLVATQKLLEKYIDQEIRVERVIGDRLEQIQGKLLSASDGLVLAGPDGSVQVLRNYSNIEFPELPGGLITKPTLEWQISAKRAGVHKTRVSYQTEGMTWWADYNLVYDEGQDANSGFVDVGAWVSIINQSGASYPEAKLKLIAGDVNRAQPNVVTTQRSRAMFSEMAAADTGFEEKSFFEFHLYTLGRPTTLPNNSTKQIELFPIAERVPAQKDLIYNGAPSYYAYGGPYLDRNFGIASNSKVETYLTFENAKRRGLGIPMPAGRIRVSKLDSADDTLEFIGEDIIDHTPRNEKIRIKLGAAFDVVGERKQTDFKIDTKAKWIEESFEIEVRNRKEESVDVIVQEYLNRWSNWKLLSKSHDFEKQSARVIHFPVTIGADKTVTLTYTVRYTW